jgi:hypothetical protein
MILAVKRSTADWKIRIRSLELGLRILSSITRVERSASYSSPVLLQWQLKRLEREVHDSLPTRGQIKNGLSFLFPSSPSHRGAESMEHIHRLLLLHFAEGVQFSYGFIAIPQGSCLCSRIYVFLVCTEKQVFEIVG